MKDKMSDIHTNEADGIQSFLMEKITQLENELKELKKEKEMNNSELVEKAVEAAQAPAQPQRAIPYGPVPMSWNISQGSSSEGPIVILSVQTPMGDQVFFVNPAVGKQLGEALIKMSSASESGLVLPGA
jgi:hypothetical protein